ncbi:MAG: translation initiation factor [Bacteroidales bacterium]
MSKNDWKSRLNVVYSTNPDFSFEREEEDVVQTKANNKQNLRVQLDKKNRGGKIVTLVTGFVGTEEDLATLGKMLKTKCGVGGTAKEGEIVVQGDHRQRVVEILQKEGYKVKSI